MSLKVRSSPAIPLVPASARIPHSPNLLHSFNRAFTYLAIGGLLLLPHVESEERAHKRPIYEELIKPEDKKIIWYSPPKKPLPDVSCAGENRDIPQAASPQKVEHRDHCHRAQAQVGEAIHLAAGPKVEIRQDLPGAQPDRRAAMAIPAPPPPPEPKPKIDKPDTQGAKSPQPNISPPAPNGDVNKAERTNTQPVEIPKPRKAFVPPPPIQQPPRAVIPVQTADVPLPDATITGAASGASRAARKASARRRSPRARRRRRMRLPVPANAAGNGKVDIAVVGLHPNDKGAVPDGSRPGQFAQAPTVGEIATGEVKGGFGVPDLTIHDDRKAVPPPHVDPPRKIVLYADRLRSLPVSTLSVPLRPGIAHHPGSDRRAIPGPQRVHHGDSDRESGRNTRPIGSYGSPSATQKPGSAPF